jgi:hypothetical protein
LEGALVSDIALIVTAVGVFGVVIGLRQSYRERLRQFEALYIQRYWKILDELSLDALRGSPLSKVSDRDEKAIRSYIVLCEDELELRKNGYIADSTYSLWADGMLTQLKQHAFENIWLRVQKEGSESGMFPYTLLSQLECGGIKDGDPLQLSATRRWLRGLRGPTGV